MAEAKGQSPNETFDSLMILRMMNYGTAADGASTAAFFSQTMSVYRAVALRKHERIFLSFTFDPWLELWIPHLFIIVF